MAQTKKRRRRKHRGTQGGRIDTRRRTARPRNRQEAKARARSQRTVKKVDQPPTWRSAINRALIGAVIVAIVITVVSKKPAQGIILGLFMLVFYIPLGYFVDSVMWRRRERQKMRAREKE